MLKNKDVSNVTLRWYIVNTLRFCTVIKCYAINYGKTNPEFMLVLLLSIANL